MIYEDKVMKGTVHQMYECVSDVLLHLDRMLGIVFMVQRGQIWPKNTKTCFDKMYPVPLRSAARSFEKCRLSFEMCHLSFEMCRRVNMRMMAALLKGQV